MTPGILRIRRRRLAVCLMIPVLVGCGAVRSREESAVAAATAFHEALDAGDAVAACALLTPATRDSLEEDGDCAAGLDDADVPSADGVRDSAVWGEAAQVKMGGDTVFLTTYDGRWLVRAAGCEPDPPRPYDCAVEGG